MDFELHQRVRVTDRQSSFYNYIGTIEQVDVVEQRYIVNGRFKGWSIYPIYAAFRADQLEPEDRDRID